MIPSPTHLNLNVFAAVAIETTGPLVGFHDLIKICIIPLDNCYEPVKGVMPFLAAFQPINDDFTSVSKDVFVKAKAVGIHPSMAGEILRLWIQRLPKQKDKVLVPISADWNFENPFVKSLFGSDVYDEVFHEAPRDLLAVCSYINDCCHFNAEEVPFPKSGITSICNRLSVQIDEPKDVLNVCKATAKAYKASLKRMFGGGIL